MELLWQPVEELNIIAGIIFDETELDEFQVTEAVFTEADLLRMRAAPMAVTTLIALVVTEVIGSDQIMMR